MKHRFALPFFAGAIGVVGLILCVATSWHLPDADPGTPWVTVALLTLGLVLANVWTPPDVGRGAATVNISSGFGIALVLLSPLAVPLVAQAVGSAVQDLRRRAGWMRLAFNSGQSVIAFCLVRVVYEGITGSSRVSPDSLAVRELAGLLAGGATFVLVNHLLTSIVLALASGSAVRHAFVEDIQGKLLSFGMDIGVAALAIPTLEYSPLLFPVMLLPLVALYVSARIRALREHESLHDVLTGLPNRALLHQSIEDATRRLRPGEALAVMLVDLDRFKQVNDTLGHPVGDQLLRVVAARLRAEVRDDDTVARLGGDEFAILAHLDEADARVAGTELGRRVVASLAEPVVLSGVRTEVGGSVGLALVPEHGLAAEELLGRADMAMYVAKGLRGTVELYDPSQEAHAAGRLQLLNELRDGIARGEVELQFQPEVRIAGYEVVRMRAAAHWRHRHRGLLDPSHFLALAESTGLALPLTTEVLRLALSEVRRWSELGQTYGVAVSLSSHHLTDAAFPDVLDALLAESGVGPQRLTLCFSESMLAADRSGSLELIRQIRARGIAVAVEDFGRADASLASLRGLEVDEVIVDSSLIGQLLVSAADAVIVSSTIELSHALGLRVGAAGVTDESVRVRLEELGCDLVRGPLVAPALSAADLQGWLARRDSAEGSVVSA